MWWTVTVHPNQQWCFLGFCSVLSLSLLFIKDFSKIKYTIHTYADAFTLHYSTYFNRRSTQQESHDSSLDSRECSASDLLSPLNGVGGTWCSSVSLKTQSPEHLFPFLRQDSAVSVFHKKTFLANLELNIRTGLVQKSACSGSGILYRLRQFCFPSKVFVVHHTLHDRDRVRPCMEHAFQVWRNSTHTAILDTLE